MPTDEERELTMPFAPDLPAILGPMRRGRADPAFRADADGWLWRTALTPAGPVTQALRSRRCTVLSRCWGPGTSWQQEHLPELLGARDVLPPELDARIDEAVPRRPGSPPPSRSLRGWRTPRAGNVWDNALAAVIEQRVTGKEAKTTWWRLLGDYGTPAPGPAPQGLITPPSPQTVRLIPSWWWRRQGVDRKRADTIMRLSRLPHVLDRLPNMEPEEARRIFTAVPGVADWTYAEVAQRALGDSDAVSVGDYHLAGQVVYAFTGAWNGTDEQMLELLAPFAGHRYRVVRAVGAAGTAKPRRGPRMTVPQHIYG